MKRHFDRDFEAVTDLIVAMGGDVQRALSEALLGLTERDPVHFERVYQIENLINQTHVTVDEQCLKLLALQSPLASDLRLVVGIIKINTDLERMGDQAVNLSQNGYRFLLTEPGNPLVIIPKMAEIVKVMVRQALDAFLQRDVALARRVLEQDHFVDAHKNEVFDVLKEQMRTDPAAIDRALELILIARNLERIADHATNIAEDAIFIVSGEDVRHGRGDSGT